MKNHNAKFKKIKYKVKIHRDGKIILDFRLWFLIFHF